MRKIQRAGIWIHRHAIESTRGAQSSCHLPSKSKDKRKVRDTWSGAERGKEWEREKIPPTFSEVTISSHLSAALAALVGKANSGKLARFATDQHASRNPTCFLSTLALLSSLGQSFSPALSLFPFPFSTPFRRYSRFTCNPFLCDPFPRRSRPQLF